MKEEVAELLARPAVATGDLAFLTGRTAAALLRPPWDLRAWIEQMERIGVRSLGVTYVTTLFTGMVLALQTAYSLPQIGVKYYIGTVVSKSLVRELGPVLIALVVGGRIGAGMTAELGTMKVSEQIDALRSMAVDPVRKLVLPRVLATMLMLPALTILGDVVGIIGGLIIGVTALDLSAGFYMNDVLTALSLEDVWSGLGKALVFGYFIAIIACRNGLTVQGGADGVGRATTRTVVTGAMFVLVSDFFLTQLFHLIF
ncbi:MAG TPA: ABC transporter permease [Thermoanaerobaculia bacterium]|nr:ABC transporter permease [Thermoanaerobaculia bacterium]